MIGQPVLVDTNRDAPMVDYALRVVNLMLDAERTGATAIDPRDNRERRVVCSRATRAILLAIAVSAEHDLRTLNGWNGQTVEGLVRLTGYGKSTVTADLHYLIRLGFVVHAHGSTHYRFREH